MALVSKQYDESESPGKPWLEYRPWASKVISCNSKRGLWMMWFFAGIWNAISSFVWFVIPEELAKGNHAILIAALFPLVGLGLLGASIYMTLGWRRFGRVAVTLDPYPGAIGGQVGGTIDLRLPYDSQHRFSLVLSCLHSYMSGSGKNRSRKEKLIWQTSGFADNTASTEGSRLNFCFDIPADLPASQPSAKQYYLWRLVLAADLPGINLKRLFELPVFPTGEKSVAPQPDSANHVHAAEHREALIESVLNIEQIPGGVELYFPILRNAGAKLVWLVFGSIFGAAGIVMSQVSDAPRFMVLIFITIGVLVTVYTFYAMFNSLKVRIDQAGISTQRRWFGLSLGRSIADRSDIKCLRVHTSYSQQTGSEHIDICKILAHTRSGKKITIAESLKGKAVALQALESIGLLCNYPIEK